MNKVLPEAGSDFYYRHSNETSCEYRPVAAPRAVYDWPHLGRWRQQTDDVICPYCGVAQGRSNPLKCVMCGAPIEEGDE